jgi:peroxiredoxin Q/BCP
MALEAGTPAPDFTLSSQSGDKVSLKDYRGKPVVFLWFPAAFTSG